MRQKLKFFHTRILMRLLPHLTNIVCHFPRLFQCGCGWILSGLRSVRWASRQKVTKTDQIKKIILYHLDQVRVSLMLTLKFRLNAALQISIQKFTSTNSEDYSASIVSFTAQHSVPSSRFTFVVFLHVYVTRLYQTDEQTSAVRKPSKP